MKRIELKNFIKEIMLKEEQDWRLSKLYEYLKYQRYSLKKGGLYKGTLKTHIEILIKILEQEYNIKPVDKRTLRQIDTLY